LQLEVAQAVDASTIRPVRSTRRSVHPPDTTAQPAELVTVVIAARNEERHIRSCLESVLRQRWAALQVIIVDGASTDRTAQIVTEFSISDPRVELLHNPKATVPVSLNLALAAARGPWLVRIDAHATVPPEYIDIAVSHLRSGRWGGVGGRKDGIGRTPMGSAIATAMGSRFGVGNSTYHYGERQQPVEHVPFGCYPISLVRELGGWDESLAVNQDFELDYRLRQAGHTLLFDPAMVIDWHSRQTIVDLYRQYRRYGAGKAVVAKKHPGSLRWRHLMAPALVASWALGGVVIWRRPRLAAGLLSPYPLALIAATAVTAPKVPLPRGRRWVGPAFAAMHAGWGIGFWSGLLRSFRR
jgi:succinoglycan biosynthesis protein ExoA